MSEATTYQRLREHLAYLGLTAAAQQLSAALDRALAEQLSATQVLEQLLELEVRETKARRQRGRLRFARYPVYKTLAQFDFDFQPALDRQLVAELSTLRFIEERRILAHRAQFFYKPQPYSNLLDYLRDLLEHPVV